MRYKTQDEIKLQLQYNSSSSQHVSLTRRPCTWRPPCPFSCGTAAVSAPPPSPSSFSYSSCRRRTGPPRCSRRPPRPRPPHQGVPQVVLHGLEGVHLKLRVGDHRREALALLGDGGLARPASGPGARGRGGSRSLEGRAELGEVLEGLGQRLPLGLLLSKCKGGIHVERLSVPFRQQACT